LIEFDGFRKHILSMFLHYINIWLIRWFFLPTLLLCKNFIYFIVTWYINLWLRLSCSYNIYIFFNELV